MYILHFVRIIEVNACFKQLLVSCHDGFLWIDQKVPMYIELIAVITRLPLVGLDPTPFFSRKEKYIALKNKLKEKYDLTRDTTCFFISSIYDHTIWFSTKVLARKLVQKVPSNQCTTEAIATTELCAINVQLN